MLMTEEEWGKHPEVYRVIKRAYEEYMAKLSKVSKDCSADKK